MIYQRNLDGIILCKWENTVNNSTEKRYIQYRIDEITDNCEIDTALKI